MSDIYHMSGLKNNIEEKKVIDQKVGLKNYQHYLTSVARTGGSGRPLN